MRLLMDMARSLWLYLPFSPSALAWVWAWFCVLSLHYQAQAKIDAVDSSGRVSEPNEPLSVSAPSSSALFLFPFLALLCLIAANILTDREIEREKERDTHLPWIQSHHTHTHSHIQQFTALFSALLLILTNSYKVGAHLSLRKRFSPSCFLSLLHTFNWPSDFCQLFKWQAVIWMGQ